MKSNMLWFPISKKALPGVLIGMEEFAHGPAPLNSILGSDSDIALGVDTASTMRLNTSDRVIVIDERKAPDLFSWLNTYTKESFPLSQFARVITERDWANLEDYYPDRTQKNDNVWASLILGEILGQGEAETDLSTLPLSRAGACYSYALARTAFTYGYKSIVTQTVKDRLRDLEKDNRFLKRQLKIDVLAKIWDVVAINNNFQLSPYESIKFVGEFLQNHSFKDLDLFGRGFDPFSVILDMKGLWSDSAEVRVRAYDDLVDFCMHQKPLQDTGFESVLIACAAFLVGRGTSHISLLNVISSTLPSCYAWFSLFATLSGPRYWHPEWAKAVRGIEKQLWQKVSICEPTTADLCWVEYLWLSNTYHGTAIYQNIPKLLPRLLSIEIVPGATCQLRLETENSVKTSAKNNNQILEANKNLRTNLVPILEKIEHLAQAAKMLHESNTAITEEQINELMLNMFPKPSKIAKRRNTKS